MKKFTLRLIFFMAPVLASADTMCANLTTPNASGVCNGAFFLQISARPAGSGNIGPFVRISDNGPIEQGFNTDARPYSANNNAGNTATFDHSELLSAINIVNGGFVSDGGVVVPGNSSQMYLQLLLDINQQKSNPLLSLDELAVALTNTTTDNPAITLDASGNPLVPNLAGNIIYNLDATTNQWIALNFALNPGSGVGDMFAFIPITQAQINACGANCDVTVYSAFGLQGGAYINNDGYEEWAAVQGAAAAPVPEPGTFSLVGGGLALLSFATWRRRKRAQRQQQP
jgi:hypothetical protein